MFRKNRQVSSRSGNKSTMDRLAARRKLRRAVDQGVEPLEQRRLLSGYAITDLGALSPNGYSIGFGINDAGQVAGESSTASGYTHAFLYANGAMKDLGTLGANQYGDNYSIGWGVNNAGQVAGYSNTASGYQHAFLYANGAMQDLGTLAGNGYSYSVAYSVNDAGQVVGYSYTGSNYHAFLYANGAMQDLGTLGADPNGYTYSVGWAVNNTGQVVGYSYTGSNYHAFLYANGAMKDLGTLAGNGAGWSYAYGVNDAGQVVGEAYTGATSHAFLWSDANHNGQSDPGEMVDLNTLLPAGSGWELQRAWGITDNGYISGFGIHNGQTRAFVMRIANSAPTAVADAATLAEDTSLSANVLANDTDPENDPITAELLTNPQHGQLTFNASGAFTYTPAPDFFGQDTFTYRAKDSAGNQSNPVTVTLTVTPVNDKPVAYNDSATTDEDQAVTIDVLANDLAGPANEGDQTLTLVAITQPAHGTAAVVNGKVVYTPDPNYNGADAFTYTVRDSDPTDPKDDSATGTVVINPQNDVPVVTDGAFTTAEDTAIDIDLRALAQDVETADADLAYTIARAPALDQGTLEPTATNGVFRFTPAANFNGDLSFAFQVTDTGDPAGALETALTSAKGTVTVHVTPVNDAPVADLDKTFGTLEDQALTVAGPGVLAGDTDVDGDTLRAVLVSGPAHAKAFHLNDDGSFTYAPDDDFNGADTFVYKATDGTADSQEVTVTIGVAPVNDAPVLRPIAPSSVDEGSEISFDTGADDVDLPPDHLTYTLLGGPAGATVDPATGAFHWTPQDSGTFTFTLGVSDNGLPALSDRRDFTITVRNVAPTAKLTNAGPVDEGSPVTVAFSDAHDPSAADTAAGFHYSYALDPSGLAASYAEATDGTSKQFTFPDNGIYTVYARIFDKDGGSTDYQTTVIVNNVAPTATITGAPDGTPEATPEGTPITLGADVTDPGVLDTPTYAWAVLKNGAAYAAGTGTSIHFTPDDNGTYTVTFTATDKDGGVGSDSATIEVANVAPTSAITGAPASSPEGTAISLGSAPIVDPGSVDTHSYLWAVTKDGQAYAVTNTHDATFGFTPDDNGTYAVTLTVADKDGGRNSYTETVVVTNVAPTPTLDPIVGTLTEGAQVSVTGSAVDPAGANDTLTYSWNVYKDGAASPFASGAGIDKSAFAFTPTDNGSYRVVLTVSDEDGGSRAVERTVTVDNVAPDTVTITRMAATGLVGPVAPGAVYAAGTQIDLAGSFADPGTADTHTYQWVITSDSLAQPVVIPGDVQQGARSLSSVFTPTIAGVYHVRLVVTDDDGGTGSADTAYGGDAYFVVYDPSAGFVTGGGWITSPAGAYAADPMLTGKATFGFVSKYQKGATVPTGNTEFQFKVGNLNFKSTSYDWMTVAGKKAQYKGSGTVNGQGNYGFILTAIDGGSTGPDQFRIKIWDKATGNVVYDNQMGQADDGSSATVLGGGSVVIQA